jgi:hypothetical protein
VTTQLQLINVSYHIRTALFRVITQHNSGDFLPTFRVNLSVTSSGVKNPKKGFFLEDIGPLKMGRLKPELTQILLSVSHYFSFRPHETSGHSVKGFIY